MKQYVEYEFYSTEFDSTLIPTEKFDRYSILATQYIDRATFGRIGENVTDEIRMATCELAESFFNENTINMNGPIASETVGPHSISYRQTTGSQWKASRENILANWLGNSNLLYAGTTYEI